MFDETDHVLVTQTTFGVMVTRWSLEHTQNHQPHRQNISPRNNFKKHSNKLTRTQRPAKRTNYPGELTKPNSILQTLSYMSSVGNGRPPIVCRFAVRFYGNQIKISVAITPQRDSKKLPWNVCVGWCCNVEIWQQTCTSNSNKSVSYPVSCPCASEGEYSLTHL
jgi:hypothetical protein